jgi:PhzF family phenazine biosynthesis protein
MAIPLLQVDAFTSRKYCGNPAGVCLLDGPAEPTWMQAVAAEMNVAETAFLVQRGEAAFDLRWFTPTVEVRLCGHATLAAAHAIFERGLAAPDARLEFATASGTLRACRGAGEAAGWIEMDFPASYFDAVGPGTEEWSTAAALGAALGTDVVAAANTGRDWVLQAATAPQVRAARPDFAAVAALGDMIILTAPADAMTAESAAGWDTAGTDFVSRCFVPAWGIPEDPVTGSAHCALAPFWAPRLGRPEMSGFQCSARGGLVRVRLADQRVILRGQAVTVIVGELAGRSG